MCRCSYTSVQVAVISSLFIGMTACQVMSDKESPKPQVTEDPKTVAQEKGMLEVHMILGEQIIFSKKDLADRLGIGIDLITLAGARQVRWSSGALGCPKPGMSYTQALVPGVLILLNAGNKSYGYHARSDGKPFYCPPEQIEVPAFIQAEDLA